MSDNTHEALGMDPDDPRPFYGKLHDLIVLVGGGEAQALAHDWFQHVAAMEPCPVCDVLRKALELNAAEAKQQELARVRALLAANVERLRTFDGYVLPSKALDAILGGEEVEAAREPREGAE